MAGPINTGNHPKLLWPGVAALIQAADVNRVEEWKDLCEVRTSDKAYEEMVREIGFTLGTVKGQGQSIKYDSTYEGPTTRWTNVTIASGYAVTMEEIDDNLYTDKMIDRGTLSKLGMIEAKENIVANIYNRGFNASYTGADGVVLFSTAHPTMAGNQSNTLATAADLSEASLEDLTVQIMGNQDDRGNLAKLMVDKLIVPRQLIYDATRILKNVDRPDTANRDINAMYLLKTFPGGLVVNRYLSDTDAFFVKTNAKNGIVLFQRKPLTFDKDNDFGTKNALSSWVERYSINWGEWRSVWGSPGA